MRTMPTEIHGGTVPSISQGEWWHLVKKLVGRRLTPKEMQWAAKAAAHNWTATVVADGIRDGILT